jgi:hypothetical protein
VPDWACAQGRIDLALVTEFLRECVARRYYAGASPPPSAARGRGPPPPRGAPPPPTFSGFHEAPPPGARTPPPAWGPPSGGAPAPLFGGARGLGSRTASYLSIASSSDYGWGSSSEAAAGGYPPSAPAAGYTALDVNGRIDD